MEMYDVETLQVKQRKILQEIYDYVSGAALGKDLYSVENDLFRYVLRMGHAFLCEVIARHGTGKAVMRSHYDTTRFFRNMQGIFSSLLSFPRAG